MSSATANDIIPSAPADISPVSKTLKERKTGYGQNDFAGASSDLPGERTCSDYLPDTDLASAKAERKLTQQRAISAESLPATFGMRKRNSAQGVGG